MRKLIIGFMIAFLIFLVIFNLNHIAASETLYVCIDKHTYLNGRARPSKKAEITMRLYDGDDVEAIRFCDEWIEVIGGESGTSFIKADYLSEIKSPVVYVNASKGRVRVRKTPDSNQTVSWIKAGETIKITRQIMGWGYTHGGWVDLQYFSKK